MVFDNILWVSTLSAQEIIIIISGEGDKPLKREKIVVLFSVSIMSLNLTVISK